MPALPGAIQGAPDSLNGFAASSYLLERAEAALLPHLSK